MNVNVTIRGCGAAAILTLAACAAMTTTAAAQTASVTYVAPGGGTTKPDTSCAAAGFSNIQAAVDAASPGGTVEVCAGIYKGSVTIGQLLTLSGRPGAVIDAKGQPYAVGIAHSNVTVTGLTVEDATENNKTHAPGDGIITAGFVKGTPVVSDDDVIVNDIATDNEGAGIDLNSTSGSIATDNTAEGNGVGINLSNDLGPPSAHNLVSGNITSNNPGGCGIVLADHTGSGVFGNVITGNTSDDNGLGTPSRPNASSGSGVILAAASKGGGVFDNLIESNRMEGNGHAGLAMHAHVKGLNFSGNRIIDNTIETNNLRTDYKDLQTTGIYIGDASPLTIEVAGNLISNNAVGVFTAGSVTITGEASNAWEGVAQPTVQIAIYGG